MTATLCILGFFAGIALTLFLFQEEIYHGQKVGYGPNDIHPDYGTQPCINAKRGQGMTPLERKEKLIRKFREESN